MKQNHTFSLPFPPKESCFQMLCLFAASDSKWFKEEELSLVVPTTVEESQEQKKEEPMEKLGTPTLPRSRHQVSKQLKHWARAGYTRTRAPFHQNYLGSCPVVAKDLLLLVNWGPLSCQSDFFSFSAYTFLTSRTQICSSRASITKNSKQ